MRPSALAPTRSKAPSVAKRRLASRLGRVTGVLAGLALAGCTNGAEVGGDPPAPVPGARAVALLRVQLPLTGNDDAVYQARVQRAVDGLVAESAEGIDAPDRRPLLVVEFVAGLEGGVTEFERALRLARFLVSDEVARVKTLAYLPGSVEGHAVLPVVACEEIAMAPEGQLGRAGADEDPSRPLEPGIRASYEQIAEARRTAPRAVVVAMVDRAAELVRVESDRGVDYVLGPELEGLREERAVISEDVLAPRGTLAAFTGREARAEGIAKYLVADRDALAQALGVAPDSLIEERSIAREWRPVMIDLTGPVTQRAVRRAESLVGDELERHAVNWVGVRIDSTGGDLAAALRLAQTLAELGGGEVRTVAYVPKRAAGPAALVALSCDQLVMQEGATLAGEGPSPEGRLAVDKAPVAAPDVEAKPDDGAPPVDLVRRGFELLGDDDAARRDAARQTVREALAPATARTWSLLAATFDPEAELVSHSNRQSGERRLLGAAELESLEDRDDWRRGVVLKEAGEPLELSADEALEAGIAWQKVTQFDDLRPLYGFAEAPRTATPNWALELVEALASPGLAALLLVIGVVGLYVELHTPGLGIGGFVAAVALLLFFWSKFLDGTADWLEVLLFIAGTVCVLLELFVLPGVGVFGVGGSLLVVASLVLASQTFILPRTEGQLLELRNSLATVAGAGLGFLVLAATLRHYLPQSALFRRATLAPLEEADRIEQLRREALADYAHLVGRVGAATTNLLPAGRAEIDGEPVDVITHGEFVDRGERVEVIEAHANRVVVRRVPS